MLAHTASFHTAHHEHRRANALSLRAWRARQTRGHGKPELSTRTCLTRISVSAKHAGSWRWDVAFWTCAQTKPGTCQTDPNHKPHTKLRPPLRSTPCIRLPLWCIQKVFVLVLLFAPSTLMPTGQWAQRMSPRHCKFAPPALVAQVVAH